MNEKKQRPYSVDQDSEMKSDSWNSKFQALADTLLHHFKLEEEQKKPGPKGVYIDFKQLK